MEDLKYPLVLLWRNPWAIIGDRKFIELTQISTGNVDGAVRSMMMLDGVTNEIGKYLEQTQSLGMESG